jgi:hypothetical protein
MVDETDYGDEPKRERMGVRSAVMSSLEVYAMLSNMIQSPIRRIASLGVILRYGMQNGMGRTKRVSMNVEQLVGKWIEAVVGMSTAHDKDAYDAHDAKADELLGPLLSAPVKQVREFYFKLLETMKSDARVPMLVWMGYEAWGAVMVKDAPDEAVKRLKHKLAAEIAEIVELDVQDQIPRAIARALCWRDPEMLQAVKETLQSGAKPKLVGRQSCLYLECGRGKKKVSVML